MTRWTAGFKHFITTLKGATQTLSTCSIAPMNIDLTLRACIVMTDITDSNKPEAALL